MLPVPGGRTLDVGCGVGDYSLGLAKLGYQATGIDLSNGMIAGARKIAEKEDLDLDLYVGPWSETTREELGWERQFDLSYSFFCPVMFDMNNIEALTKTSRNACLFVGFAGRQDTIVDALYEHFYGQKDDFKWQANVDDVIATVKKVGQDVAVEYVNVPEVEFSRKKKPFATLLCAFIRKNGVRKKLCVLKFCLYWRRIARKTAAFVIHRKIRLRGFPGALNSLNLQIN